jgi:hypothetical protein
LQLIVSASPPRLLPTEFAREWKLSPQQLESIFGRGAARSECSFLENLYEFTPDKMHRWALSPSVHYREQMLLMLKTVLLSQASADTGIFNIQSQSYRGFQLGDPQAHPRKLAVQLYSDEGTLELIFGRNDGRGSVGVTQPELNRIMQSLRKAPPDGHGYTN